MHCIHYASYPINTSRDIIEREMSDFAVREGDYHTPIPNIDFREKCFDSYNEAQEYIKNLNGWYLNVAVRYREPKDFKPSAKLIKLRDRVNKAKTEFYSLERKFHFANHKSEFVGCKKCGSKISLKHLTSNTCPICRCDMRPSSIREKLRSLDKKREELISAEKKLLKIEEKKQLSKSADMKWLVKIEFHT